MAMNRRNFLKTTGGILVAPAIINIANLMPVKADRQFINVIDLSDIRGEYEDAILKMVKAECEKIHQKIIAATPIDTGSVRIRKLYLDPFASPTNRPYA